MKKSREELLAAIKHTLKTITFNDKVILFGSQARGTSNPDSDWDILVILDKPKIELYTKTEWQKRSFTPFYKNIEKEGILL